MKDLLFSLWLLYVKMLDQIPISDPCLCSFFIAVPPETTGWAPHRSTSEEELTGAEKRMVGGKWTLREKREERDGKRGVMGRLKYRESSKTLCVLVLSWCLPAGLDTIPQLCPCVCVRACARTHVCLCMHACVRAYGCTIKRKYDSWQTAPAWICKLL